MKLLLTIFIALSFFSFGTDDFEIRTVSAASDTGYVPLEPLPDENNIISEEKVKVEPKQYIERIYYFAFTLVIILAVVMIMKAAVLYTAAGVNPTEKNIAKESWQQALMGLALALLSYLLLSTINPDLVTPRLTAPDIPSNRIGQDPPCTTEEPPDDSTDEFNSDDDSTSDFDPESDDLPDQTGDETSDDPDESLPPCTDDTPPGGDQPPATGTFKYGPGSNGMGHAYNGSRGLPTAAAEAAIRERLDDAGVRHKDNVCNQEGQTGCTNISTLSPKSINGVIALKAACGDCVVHITGGTENGHATHGPGAGKVDLDDDAKLNTFIRANGERVRMHSSYEQYRYAGAIYTLEGTHWHVNFDI